MNRTKRLSAMLVFSVCMIAPYGVAHAQGVSVDTRSAAESQSNVRIQGGGQGVEVETNSSAQSGSRTRVRDAGNGVRVDTQSNAASQSNVRVQGGEPGQSIEVNSGAAAGTQNRVRMDNGGAGAAIDSRSGAASQSNVRVYAPASPPPPVLMVPQPEPVHPVPAPVQPSYQTAVPPPAQPLPAISGEPAPPSALNGAPRPVNCEKIEEVTIDEMNIKIINKSCRGKIMSLQAWRENGKTKVQFIFDNKGFSNTTIKMSETWFDRRGRAINETIDEQKFAIEANHNKAVILTGPIPQAMTAVINFYR